MSKKSYGIVLTRNLWTRSPRATAGIVLPLRSSSTKLADAAGDRQFVGILDNKLSDKSSLWTKILLIFRANN